MPEDEFKFLDPPEAPAVKTADELSFLDEPAKVPAPPKSDEFSFLDDEPPTFSSSEIVSRWIETPAFKEAGTSIEERFREHQRPKLVVEQGRIVLPPSSFTSREIKLGEKTVGRLKERVDGLIENGAFQKFSPFNNLNKKQRADFLHRNPLFVSLDIRQEIEARGTGFAAGAGFSPQEIEIDQPGFVINKFGALQSRETATMKALLFGPRFAQGLFMDLVREPLMKAAEEGTIGQGIARFTAEAGVRPLIEISESVANTVDAATKGGTAFLDHVKNRPEDVLITGLVVLPEAAGALKAGLKKVLRSGRGRLAELTLPKEAVTLIDDTAREIKQTIEGKAPIAGSFNAEIGDITRLIETIPKKPVEIAAKPRAKAPKARKPKIFEGQELSTLEETAEFVEGVGKQPKDITFTEATLDLGRKKATPPEPIPPLALDKPAPKILPEPLFSEKTLNLARKPEAKLANEIIEETATKKMISDTIKTDLVALEFNNAKSRGVTTQELIGLRNKHLRGSRYIYGTKAQKQAYRQGLKKATQKAQNRNFSKPPPPPKQITEGVSEVPNLETSAWDLNIGVWRPTRARYRAGGLSWEEVAYRKREATMAKTIQQESEYNLLNAATKGMKSGERLELGEFLIYRRDWFGNMRVQGDTFTFKLPDGKTYSKTLTEKDKRFLKYWDDASPRLGKEGGLAEEAFVENYAPKIGFNIANYDSKNLPNIFREEIAPRAAEPFFKRSSRGKKIPPELDVQKMGRGYIDAVLREKYQRPILDEAAEKLTKLDPENFKGGSGKIFRRFVIDDMKTWYGHPTNVDEAFNSLYRFIRRDKPGINPRGAETAFGFLKSVEYGGGLALPNFMSPLKNIVGSFANLLGEAGPIAGTAGILSYFTNLFRWVASKGKKGRLPALGEFGIGQEVVPLIKTTGTKNLVQRSRDVLASLFTGTERFARQTTGGAAEWLWGQAHRGKPTKQTIFHRLRIHRQDKAFRQHFEKAYAENRPLSKRLYVQEIDRNVNFPYEAGEQATIFRGQAKGALLGVFTTWPANYAELWGKWIRNRDVMAATRHVSGYVAMLTGMSELLGLDVYDWAFSRFRIGGRFVLPIPSAPVEDVPSMAPLASGLILPLITLLTSDNPSARREAERDLRSSAWLHIPVGGSGLRRLISIIEEYLGKDWTPSLQDPFGAKPLIIKGGRVTETTDVLRRLFGGPSPRRRDAPTLEDELRRTLEGLRILSKKNRSKSLPSLKGL